LPRQFHLATACPGRKDIVDEVRVYGRERHWAPDVTPLEEERADARLLTDPIPMSAMTRRTLMRRLVATATALPRVMSIVAPTPNRSPVSMRTSTRRSVA
jgi:hypothetical protein